MLDILAEVMAQEVPEPPAEEKDKPKYPAYQTEGLERLTEAGIIDSPEVWKARFGDTVTVGQMFGILGKLLARAESPAD